MLAGGLVFFGFVGCLLWLVSFSFIGDCSVFIVFLSLYHFLQLLKLARLLLKLHVVVKFCWCFQTREFS